MYTLGKWSMRHARSLEWFSPGFEKVMVALHPLWRMLGYERFDKLVAFIEKRVKGPLFDCRMYGACAHSSTDVNPLQRLYRKTSPYENFHG